METAYMRHETNRTLKGDEKINSFPLNEKFSGLLPSYELCLTLISLS